MCDCVETMNEKLKEHNCRISQGMRLIGNSLKLLQTFVVTENIDSSKRKRPPSVVATFCPFCGEEYDHD